MTTGLGSGDLGYERHYRDLGALGYFLALSVLVWYPLLTDGFVLTLDMVFSPYMDHTAYGLSVTDPLYYGRLPLLAILDLASVVLGHQFVQKVILIGIITGSGFSMYRAGRDWSLPAQLFAGTLYAINPFVYVRFLAGHWQFLVGYAVFPLAVVMTYAYLAERDSTSSGRLLGTALLVSVAAAVDPHIAVLLVIVLGSIAGLLLWTQPAVSLLSRLVRLGGVTIGLSAFWLLPAFFSILGGGSKLTVIAGTDLATFSANGTISRNVPLSVAMLYGFWRDGYTLSFDVLPNLLVWVLFFLIICLATYGFYYHRRDPLVTAITVSMGIGFVLSHGVSYPVFAGAFEFLFDHVFILRGMRDTQKFVLLLAFGYAFLGGLGVTKNPFDIPLSWSMRTSQQMSHRGVVRQIGTVLFLVALLSIPLVYTAPMLSGFGGQLNTTEYPDEWHHANNRFNQDGSTYRVLFLPWHQYLSFTWTDRTIVNPADAFFEQSVIRGRNAEVLGIESQGDHPAHQEIARILDDHGDRTDFGARVNPLGVKYVILEKSVNYERYSTLHEQTDLEIVLENDQLVVFENQAFTPTPQVNWPRASTPVPWSPLFVGSAISFLTVLLTALRSRRDALRGALRD